MTAENDQLALFAPEKPAPQPARIGPARVYTMHDVVSDFLDRRPAKGCRNCHCTDANPCGLSDGDKCTINQQTGYCSAPVCLAAAVRAKAEPVYPRAVGR